MDPRIQIKKSEEKKKKKIVAFKDFYIYFEKTVFGGIRLKPYYKDDIDNLIFRSSEKDWCAGKDKNDIIRLLNVMIQLIDEDILDDYPLCSKQKPYINDPEFCNLIKDKTKIYITLEEIKL